MFEKQLNRSLRRHVMAGFSCQWNIVPLKRPRQLRAFAGVQLW